MSQQSRIRELNQLEPLVSMALTSLSMALTSEALPPKLGIEVKTDSKTSIIEARKELRVFIF